MKNFHFFIFFVMVSLCAGCELMGLTPGNNDSKDTSLTDTWWWLDSFEDGNGEKSGIGSENVAILFRSDSTLGGVGIWSDTTKGNEIYGVYRLEPATVCVGSTRKGVPEGSRSDEFVQSLKFTETIRITSDRLILTLQNGSGRIYLKQGEQPPHEVDFNLAVSLRQELFQNCF